MSELVNTTGHTAGEAAVTAAWAQWSAVTSSAVPERKRAEAIVDPEALLLVSLAFADKERRFHDFLAGWASDASYLLSVQRMRTLSRDFPKSVHARLGGFAHIAAEAGQRSWGRLANPDLEGLLHPRQKRLGDLNLKDGPSLMLRMRAGFGVGAKADLLTFLLGIGHSTADLKVMAGATGYTVRALNTAAEQMTVAGFIHSVHRRPSVYYARADAWAPVLDTQAPDRNSHRSATQLPAWRYWRSIFAFLVGVVEWAEQASQLEWSSYVASSRARDLYDCHGNGLRLANLEFQPPKEARGAAYLSGFADLVAHVGAWTAENA